MLSATRHMIATPKLSEGGSRDQTSLDTNIDIFFPVHDKGDYVGAQSETNAKWPAREWRELGSRDMDHRTRGARVRAREAIESKLSEFRRFH
jgi:hypothetical protein